MQGNLSSLFLPRFCHHNFLLDDNRPLMSFYVDVHIIYHQIDYLLLLKTYINCEEIKVDTYTPK